MSIKKRALIIEDERITIGPALRILESRGWKWQLCENTDLAFEKVRDRQLAEKFSVLIVDMRMPKPHFYPPNLSPVEYEGCNIIRFVLEMESGTPRWEVCRPLIPIAVYSAYNVDSCVAELRAEFPEVFPGGPFKIWDKSKDANHFVSGLEQWLEEIEVHRRRTLGEYMKALSASALEQIALTAADYAKKLR